ncbi:MAG: Eco57I restriction-modification methylase domain-containing protein [Bacteroidales bacterium]|nr:Eco57I restriction-modification methylase domain-containing protein [Bacteroidales bacterium]
MKRKNGRNHGEVFTKLNVVKYILDEVGYLPSENLKNMRILEPASGQGAFAIEIINRLVESSLNFGFDFIIALNQNIQLVEIDKLSFENLKNNIFNTIRNNGYLIENVSLSIFSNSNYLQYQTYSEFDCIVGNPPYVRHEIIDSKLKSIYKKEYSTFKYRADLYIPFYEKSLKLLSKKGKLSFICSNRWLFNQYGKPLREMIAKQYHLSKIINIEKVNAFDEEVIAYPCITTIQNGDGNMTKYYESQEKKININNIDFTLMATPKSGSWQNLFLDYNINHKYLVGIEDQNFKIGIGIATGADKIFIKKHSELNGIEKSRLMPLIKSKSLKGNEIDWDNSYVINTFEKNSICDLNNFPHLNDYLNSYRDILLKRHIAKKNPTYWYKTIDKIKPDLQKQHKLLLPDLSGSKFLFIDEGKFYPHHNVYYITHKNLNKLKILACILMSDFIKDQLSQIGIRMNGGLPRFQSQTLKKIRIPNIEELTIIDRELLIDSYNNRNLNELNRIVNKYCTQHSIKAIAGIVDIPSLSHLTNLVVNREICAI